MESPTSKRGVYPLHGYKLGLYRIPIKLEDPLEIQSIHDGLKNTFEMDMFADRIYATYKWRERNMDDPDASGYEEVELSPEMEELAKKYESLISEIEKLSVVELAELVQVLEKKFGVSAAAPVAAAGGGGEVEEKDSFNIMLKASGDQKINVIKAIREITGLGLKESKDMADGAPQMLKEGVKTEEANEFKQKLEEAGATVELQ